MSNPPVITDVEKQACREEWGGVPRCKLHTFYKTTEVSGFPFLDVLENQDKCKYVNLSAPRPTWAPGQFDIFVVGEAPGHEEDRYGMPFQGQAGGILSEFLQDAGLNLDRIFVTNIVRCRPPKNRKPTAKEYQACIPHLLREIKQVQPKVFLLLGNSALRLFRLDKEGGVTSIRGKMYERKLPDWEDGPTFKVIPTFHPAAFLHRKDSESRRLMNRVVDDYKLAGAALQGAKTPPYYVPDWQLIDSLDKLDKIIAEIKDTKFFSWDTESPESTFVKEPLLCLSLAWGYPKKCGVIPFMKHKPRAEKLEKKHYDELWAEPTFGYDNQTEVVKRLKEVFEDPSIAKAAFNAKYDMNVLRFQFNIRTKGFIYDPMVMHHLLDEHPPHDLAFLSDTELKVGDYEAPRKEVTGKGKKLVQKFDKVPDHILWPYTSTDTENTLRLAGAYHQRLLAKPHLWKLYCEESEPGIHALAVAEWHGNRIDPKVAKGLKKKAEEDQKKLLIEMRKITSPDFNPLSNPQVIEEFKKLGKEQAISDPKTASGYCADKKRLNEIKDEVELAGQILTYRTNRKMISTYYDHALDFRDKNDRIRHSFRQHGTVTGRLSATFLHQIVKIDEGLVTDSSGNYVHVSQRFPDRLTMRDMFISAPGYRYVYGDYSQVELRILAIISKDKELKRVFDEGLDLHAITTAEILKTVMSDYDDEKAKKDKFNRSEVGKRVNFGLAYGSKGHALVKTGKWKDAKGIQRSFNWTMLNEGMANWKKRFQGVGAFIDKKPDEVRWNRNIAVNCFGRERRFGGKLNAADDYERGEAERECVNYFIQSAAGGITNRTVNEVHKHLQGHIDNGNLDENAVYLVNTVHDSIAYEVREDLVPWFLEFFKEIATRPIPELNNECFPFDLGVGNSWTEAEMAA